MAVPLTQNTWFQLAGTDIASVLPSPLPSGQTGPVAITTAWSGATVDRQRSRLYINGGGHGDYPGNEIYRFDDATGLMTRLNDPGQLFLPGSCVDAIAGGTQPNSRHTYGTINFLPNENRLVLFWGSLSCSLGDWPDTRSFWEYDMVGGTWTNYQATLVGPFTPGQQPNDSSPLGCSSAYHPTIDRILIHSQNWLYMYDHTVTPRTITLIGTNGTFVDQNKTAVVDSLRNLFIIIGGGEVISYNIGSSVPGQETVPRVYQSAPGNSVVNGFAPGVAYDEALDRVVGWNGGTTLYFLNTATWGWSSQSMGGANPGSALGNGTYGRFAYFPVENYHVVYNSINNDTYAIRTNLQDTEAPSVPTGLASTTVHGARIDLSWNASTDNVGVTGYRIFRDTVDIGTSPTTTFTDNLNPITQPPGQPFTYQVAAFDAAANESARSQSLVASATGNWTSRSTGAGVTRAFGWDDANDWVVGDNRFGPLGYGFWGQGSSTNPSTIFWSQDFTRSAPGDGGTSARVEIPTNSGQDCSGRFEILLNAIYGPGQSGGREFYVQFRQRWDQGSFWTFNFQSDGSKHVIFSAGQITCQETEITQQRHPSRGPLPHWYTDCGSRGVFTIPGTTTHTTQTPPYSVHNTDIDPLTCGFPNGAANFSGCWRYDSVPDGTWVTFYWRVLLPTNWGVADGEFDAWIYTDPSDPNSRVHVNQVREWAVNNSTPGQDPGFDRVTVTPYQTNKNSSLVHPSFFMNYDSLIVSSNPIPAPESATQDTTPPASPTGLQVTGTA